MRRKDGQTGGRQQRRNEHQRPLRARLSAGGGIRAPEAGQPPPLQRGQAAERRRHGSGEAATGSHRADGGEEAPAQTQLEAPLRGDGDAGQGDLRQSEEGGGASEPEDGE